MSHGKKKFSVSWLLFWVGMVLMLVTIGIVLYDKTQFMKDFVKGFMWFWDGLRKWHWE